jgi:ATP-dependent Clp protease, protease subunit
MAGTPAQQLFPSEIYATLTGPVDQSMVQRVFQAFANAMHGGTKSVHLLFHSTGGTVGDGVALYDYFRSVPIDLRIYNGGSVSSIAVIAFLGAKQRYASAHATFVVHRSYAPSTLFNSAAAANAERLRGIAQGLEIDDARTRAILKANLNLSEEKLEEHLVSELPFDANRALQCGLITAISDFAPPVGTKFFNI